MRAGPVVGWRRRRPSLCHWFLIGTASLTVIGLFILTLRSVEPSSSGIKETTHRVGGIQLQQPNQLEEENASPTAKKIGCATVEEMGETFRRGFREESLRARQIIHRHFNLNGAPRVRALPPEQFCKHGFVLGKASEAGLGNEIGKYPFGDYILYSNLTFTLTEVKHLWRMNGCVAKYGRHLVMRIDDFLKPARTNVLCGNWREWKQPIIWFQNTTDAVAAQFFLKNVHPEMRKTASDLFGEPENLQHRPNVFGELMRVLISPSENVELAVNWALGGGGDPDIAVHMRMLMNRSVRVVRAALDCIGKTAGKLSSRPKVVIVSDTPSLLKDIELNLVESAEVLHFDYEHFEGNITAKKKRLNNLKFRVRDWGPAPRWVAFVDFFLASRAKHAVISGAHRRVGTTYAQLIAALAAAHSLEDNSSAALSFTYLSSFQSNLLLEGLRNQIGWGHVWNRFAGPLSCSHQPNQCAYTPVLPPAWWDGLWQSPIPRDGRRMEAYGVRFSGLGTVDEDHLCRFCNSRKISAVTVTLI
ncbi:hypothetical protein ACH5RR_014576 [Cinchona calisaya]|uniref:Uncharacterized protein n=1 Tax=Cinchona calisaya TaxID=153742 RepID=A0ABD3A4P5_9GENT